MKSSMVEVDNVIKNNLLGVLRFKPASVAQANEYTVTELDCPVRLRMGTSSTDAANAGHDEGAAPLTLHSLFVNTLERGGAHLPALVCKRDGMERSWTFLEYYRECVATAKALLALGLAPHDTLGILGFNAPEWFFANLGAIFAGCVILCQVLVVENAAQINKLEKLPLAELGIRAVVYYAQACSPSTPSMPATIGDVRVLSWTEFLELNKDGHITDEEIIERISAQAPNHCAELIYTSGTTGSPKAAMISHDNLTWTSYAMAQKIHLKFGVERTVSFLPLSHVAAQIADLFVPLAVATCVHFARPDALRGSLTETMIEAQPTYFFAVPRVWEKFADRIQSLVRQSSSLRQTIFSWARYFGLRAGLEASRTGLETSAVGGWSHSIAKKLVFAKLRARLGLTETCLCMTSAAPISRETLEFFLSLDIPIFEIFGITECTGPHNVSVVNGFIVGTCGTPLRGSQSIIEAPDETGEGEVLVDGRNIFMGYYKNSDENQATFNSHHQVRTGDQGKIDSDGYLTITGRLKELVITAGGENIAPVPIEMRFKQALPELVSNCMLVGDRRKYLSMLVSLRVELDPETLAPTDRLTNDAKTILARECEFTAGSITELIADLMNKNQRSKLDRLFQTTIERVNARAVSNAARVQRYELLPRDFSILGGELGPTMKLRRSVVARQYAALIEGLYANAENSTND